MWSVLGLALFVVCATASTVPPEYVIRLKHDGNYMTLYDRIPSLSVDRPRGNGLIDAYVLPEDLELLSLHNYSYEILPHEGMEQARQLRDRVSKRQADMTEWEDYHDYDALTTLMQDFAETYSDITSLTSIGEAEPSGRKLWCLKITEDPNADNENKPEIHYVGNMHGDEVVGRELLLRFIDMLLVGYRHGDTRVTRLVENTVMYIIPSMNPDGFELGTRGNGHRQDLNRNFPDKFRGDSPHRQKETQAIMDWEQDHHFVISINFHGGACVVSFPLDGTASGETAFSPSPDDRVIQQMSRKYAQSNLPMFRSREFQGGVTNGAKWYPLYGGMADWKYETTGNIELTVELSDVKWPQASTLDGFWQDNQESMLGYFENIFTAVWGRVTIGGEACRNADVVVDGIRKHVKANKFGYYARVLRDGQYDITFVCNGNTSPSFQATVTKDTPVILDYDFQVN